MITILLIAGLLLKWSFQEEVEIPSKDWSKIPLKGNKVWRNPEENDAGVALFLITEFGED